MISFRILNNLLISHLIFFFDYYHLMLIKNKKAFHDYFIEDQLETGIVLEGWEVKSLKNGQGTLNEAYIKEFKNELYLVGSNISPLNTSNNYINYDKIRTKVIT